MKSKIFVNVAISLLYIITYILATLFIGNVITIIDQCEYYTLEFSSLPFFIFKIILLPVLGYIYVKVIKISKMGIVIFCFIVPSFSIVFDHHSSINMLEKILDTGESKVVQAELVNKHQGRSTRSVTYRLFSENNIKRQSDINPNKWDKLKIGDTILIKLKQECIYIRKIYTLTPNQKELEDSKKGCYLIGGKLITSDKKTIISISEPYKKSKPTLIGCLFLIVIGLVTLFLIFMEVSTASILW